MMAPQANFFKLGDGRYLTQSIFSSFLDTLLVDLHLVTEQFNTHSFHIGAATSAKTANISDMHIQMKGCRKSNANKLYI